MKRICPIFCAVMLCFFLAGCSLPITNDYFAYSGSDFSARVCGVLNGVEFEAEITKIGNSMAVKYTSPPSLSGIRAVFDGERESVFLDSLSSVLDAEGLLRPGYAFIPDGDITSVQKQNGAYTVTVEDKVYIFPEGFGYPENISGENFSLRTVSFSVDKQGK